MRIKLKDFSVDYIDSRNGKPLLLIHAFPLNRAMWEPQISQLGEGTRTIAFDQRGNGSSDPVAGPYSVASLAEDCRDLLRALSVTEPVVLCGISMGGYVAFEFYRQNPGQVAGLILGGTRASADSEEGKAKRIEAAADVRMKGMRALIEKMLPKMLAPGSYAEKPELVAEVRAMMKRTSLDGALGDIAALRDRPDSTPTLATINKPTLILHGSDDQIIPVAEAQAMHAGIAGSKLTVIPAAGHLLNLDQPEAFNEAVRGFMAGLA